MSIKKTITATFLLFVTVCMVAHSAVVHHHSGNSHSITEHHELDCEEQHSHENHDCEHEKHNNITCCTIDNCLLNDFYTFARSYKITKHHSHNCTVCCFMISNYYLPQTYYYTEFDFGEIPFVPIFYSEFVARSIGLRAPPVC
ncbi:MAG: hypothetical protein FWC39_13835 [Bacteroidetes bacterium]|nr:hypothetical protein [Bacteroidota bacterium]